MGSPESLARGMLSKGTSREPRRAPYLSRSMGVVTPNPNGTRSLGSEGHPRGSKADPHEEKPVAKGNRRRQLRVDEQSYESIVPMKVENRRAPARGGHGIHWREG